MTITSIDLTESVLIHDLEPSDRLDSWKAALIFKALPMVAWCRGCFGCWVKTPGKCLLADRTAELAKKMSSGLRLTVVSRLVFGGLSPAVKAVFDRSIGYILPFFRLIDNHMRHETRYPGKMSVSYLFYGPSEEPERDLARKLAKANVKNLDASLGLVDFYPTAEDLIKSISPISASDGLCASDHPGARAPEAILPAKGGIEGEEGSGRGAEGAEVPKPLKER